MQLVERATVEHRGLFTVTRAKKNKQAGEAFKELLIQKGFKNYRLAKETGLGIAHIGRIASGEIASPEPTTLAKIATVLGVELSELTRIFAQSNVQSQHSAANPQPQESVSEIPISNNSDFLGREDAIKYVSFQDDFSAQVISIEAGIQQNEQKANSSANLIHYPPTLKNWQGRGQEIQQITTWLADNDVNIIGIQGLTGIGKSCLVAKVYESQLFEAGFWADVREGTDFSVFAKKALTELAGKSSEELAILREPSQLIFALLDILRQRPCLLVFDNLETLLDQERHFREHYKYFFNRWIEHGTTSKILLTTQIQPEVMEGHGYWLSLQGLKVTEGAKLLLDLGIVGSDEELQDFSKYLDGHPMMLRLVASKLKPGTHILKAKKLRFSQLDLLLNNVTMTYRDRERFRFVWILEQHFKELNPKLKRFFLNLSIFRHDFDLYTASEALIEAEELTSIWGSPTNNISVQLKPSDNQTVQEPINAWETQQALDELISRSLLDLLPARQKYQFHPFVLQYAKQKTSELEEAFYKKAFARKLAIYYLSITPTLDTWETLDHVMPFVDIFYLSCEVEAFLHAYEILVLYIDEYLHLRGYNTLLAELYEYLLQVFDKSSLEIEKLAVILTRLGSAYLYLGQPNKVIEICLQGLKIARELGNYQAETDALCSLGNAYERLEQYEEALECHKQHLVIARMINNQSWEAVSLHNISNVYLRQVNSKKAMEYANKSLTISQEIGDLELEATALCGLGNIYGFLKEHQLAIDYYHNSLEMLEKVGTNFKNNVGNYCSEGAILNNIASNYNQMGQYEQAITFFNKGLGVAQDIGDSSMISFALEGLGEALIAQGSVLNNLAFKFKHSLLNLYNQAIDFYEKGLAIAEDIGNFKLKALARQGLHITFCNLSHAYRALGEYKQANDYYQQAIEIIESKTA
ncbi:MAG: tetratricopeptide repeat protein [Nostoc sp.]|uniref:tetratricopeptide repeat protein n=1 Tax=Nostoc sp. TaxID=1180 RepID=UPI002FF5FBD3